MSKVKILGVGVDNLSFKETTRIIAKILENQGKGFVVTANPEILYRAFKDKNYQQILNSADLVTPDGTGVLWAARRAGIKIPERVTGVDLVWALLKLAEDYTYKVFLLGGKPADTKNPEIAKIAARRMRQIHPRLKIVGATYGFWNNQGSKEKVCAEIQKTKPNLIFVALGAPHQERWIWENLKQFSAPCVAIGIGGTLDMIAGKFRRAPLWMRRSGLEWLWRLFQEPKRISRIWNVIMFVLVVLFTKNK